MAEETGGMADYLTELYPRFKATSPEEFERLVMQLGVRIAVDQKIKGMIAGFRCCLNRLRELLGGELSPEQALAAAEAWIDKYEEQVRPDLLPVDESSTAPPKEGGK